MLVYEPIVYLFVYGIYFMSQEKDTFGNGLVKAEGSKVSQLEVSLTHCKIVGFME